MTSLNVGCGPYQAAGWVNVDVIETADIRPDVIASLDALPYDDGTVDRVYAGHVLEHVPLDRIDAALGEVARVLIPGGAACFVCPDVYRAIEWYRDGRAGFELVEACLEGPDGGIADADAWDGCFHRWNCFEARLLDVVRRTFPAAAAVPMDAPELAAWPTVSLVGWQCAVTATAG